MDKETREGLAKAGYVVGDAEDFLELNDEERELVEFRVALSRAVRSKRIKQGLTQAQAAKVMKTTQPNVSKIEAAAPGVSFDLMVRSFFRLGGTAHEVFMPAPERPKKPGRIAAAL